MSEMVTTHCPHCNGKMKHPPEWEQAICPGCHKQFSLPSCIPAALPVPQATAEGPRQQKHLPFWESSVGHGLRWLLFVPAGIGSGGVIGLVAVYSTLNFTWFLPKIASVFFAQFAMGFGFCYVAAWVAAWVAPVAQKRLPVTILTVVVCLGCAVGIVPIVLDGEWMKALGVVVIFIGSVIAREGICKAR